LEESLLRGLKFAVFEPNAEPLWAHIRLAAGAFMNNLFRQGAFAGNTPKDSYFVMGDNRDRSLDGRFWGFVKKDLFVGKALVIYFSWDGNAPDILRYSGSLGEDAAALLKRAAELGLEGLIGKRKDSAYEAGRRSGAWIKLKLHREQEFVIGGYTNPEGTRLHFGALLVGFYEKGKLNFCGRVGTGFDARRLKSLHAQLDEIARDECPFANLPELRGSHYSPRITRAEMKKCHWVEPRMVCQIKFAEWTRDNKLRQPVFLGLREDKDAAKVVREKAEA